MQSLVWNFAAGLLVGLPLAALAYRARALDANAALLSVIFACAYMLPGPVVFAAALTFFASSSVVTRLGYARKEKLGAAESRRGRSAAQVVGAGGAAALLCLLAVVTPHGHSTSFTLAAVAALAASNADTWAAEVGSLSRRKPKLILNPRLPIEPGTSGGVTLLGEAASAAGSALVALVVLALSQLLGIGITAQQVALIALLGWAGELLDSIVGALLQAKYFCETCKVYTDKPVHKCGSKTAFTSGLKFVTNEVTNIISTCTVAAAAVLIFS
uniref:DUF92 domain-containing protein n=1 Tax=Thermofilum pendens TaxID=2269 RepID=A0A7J3X8R3_THEPE